MNELDLYTLISLVIRNVLQKRTMQIYTCSRERDKTLDSICEKSFQSESINETARKTVVRSK